MNEQIKSRLSFENYEVKKVILEQNEKFKNEGKPIDIEFNMDHHTNIDNDKMKIELTITIFENAQKNNFPFYMQVVACGNFEIQGEDIERFEINGIAILYPYIRAIISTYTANSNIPTLVLPPINVANYYKEHIEKQKSKG